MTRHRYKAERASALKYLKDYVSDPSHLVAADKALEQGRLEDFLVKLTIADAKKYSWYEFGDNNALIKINKILDGHGVESIRSHAASAPYYVDIAALYVNMGDSYATTVVYETGENRWHWPTTLGDFIEQHGERLGIE